MKEMRMKRIVVMLVGLVLACASLFAVDGGRFALVVGNGNYKGISRLANPTNDATDIAKLLTEAGFSVRLETDTTLSKMEGAVREFSAEAKAAKAETTLFFYAGHGVQFEGVNYLIPVDADIQMDYELRSKAVSMEMVASALEDAKSEFNLILLDACRDNPFSSSRGGSRGLVVMGGGTPESMVVFATSPGSVAQDGGGSNSPFTSALKEYLLTPDLEVRQLVASVSKKVQSLTSGKQIPWVNTSFTGSFYFITAQQQLQRANAEATRLQVELAALEQEIAQRQKSISSETNAFERQKLELEQQRAKALETSKKLEVQRMEQIRKQAEYEMAVQEKELAEKRALEATVVGQQEELARQAAKRRSELAELKRSMSSDVLERLDLIAKMGKAISDIEESFSLSIDGTKDELKNLQQQQVDSYQTTNPQDPWETMSEFNSRVATYRASLVAEGEGKIREIENQRNIEVGKINVQLEQSKRELKAMTFTLGPTSTKVKVDKFDTANKRFPITVSSTDSSLPFEISLFYNISSTEREKIQKEYQRVDGAEKAQALVGTISYSMKELSPIIWQAETTGVMVKTLLEGTTDKPGLIVIADSAKGILGNSLSYIAKSGAVVRVYGVLPIRSSQGPMEVYANGQFLGTADATNPVWYGVEMSQSAKAVQMKFVFLVTKKTRIENMAVKAGLNDSYYPIFKYTIGENGPAGGHVFYDKGSYSDGWRFLEAATVSNEWITVWGGSGTIVGGTATAIGTGASNTEKIVSKFGNREPYENKSDYAAKLCADLVVRKAGVTYNDWFLPSKDELDLMYENLKRNNLGGGADEDYWSSSEYSAGGAWYQNFDRGYQRSTYRIYSYRVRPVRAF